MKRASQGKQGTKAAAPAPAPAKQREEEEEEEEESGSPYDSGAEEDGSDDEEFESGDDDDEEDGSGEEAVEFSEEEDGEDASASGDDDSASDGEVDDGDVGGVMGAAAAQSLGGRPRGRGREAAGDEEPGAAGASADPGSDSSEDEHEDRNTIGNVPLEWYRDEAHSAWSHTADARSEPCCPATAQQALGRRSRSCVASDPLARIGHSSAASSRLRAPS